MSDDPFACHMPDAAFAPVDGGLFREPSRVLVCDGAPPWILWAQRGYSWPATHRANGFDLPATHVPVPASLKGIPLHRWSEVDITSLLREKMPSQYAVEDVFSIDFQGMLIQTGGTHYTGDVEISARGHDDPYEALPGSNLPRYYWQIVCTPRTGVRMPFNGSVCIRDGRFDIWVRPITNGAAVYVSGYDYPAGPTFGVDMWLSKIYLK